MIGTTISDARAGFQAILGFVEALPARASEMVVPIIVEVLEERTGLLLWIGGIIALWTVSNFVETIRDIILRAFGAEPERHFVVRRLRAIGGTVLAMLLVLVAVLSQVALVVTLRLADIVLDPLGFEVPRWLNLPQLITPVLIFLSLWALYHILAPRKWRHVKSWPGAAVTTVAWLGGVYLMGPILQRFTNMSLTYGALSGLMLMMLFFYVVGFALVLGAQLNAALARRRPNL
jgi:membrane protein